MVVQMHLSLDLMHLPPDLKWAPTNNNRALVAPLALLLQAGALNNAAVAMLLRTPRCAERAYQTRIQLPT